jgi:hypothetical protein
VIKLYFNISNEKEYTDPNKFYEKIQHPKLRKKMINYYKTIKKNISNIFIYFFNDINNSNYYLNIKETPLKVHKLDDQDIQLRYDPLIRRMITNYLNIHYNIRGTYYHNTNLFTITVPLGNLNDYIQSSFEYTFKRTPIFDDKLRYILYNSHLNSQGDPGVGRFITFLNIILDKFIVVEKLKTQNDMKYKLINLNPIRYPYINYHNNTTIHLFPTRLVSYRSPEIRDTQIGSYNRTRFFRIQNIPILLNNYDEKSYPQVILETFHLSIHNNVQNNNNDDNNNENRANPRVPLVRVIANTGRNVWRRQPPAPADPGQVPPPAPAAPVV